MMARYHIRTGMRVQLAPHTDLFMRGERYANVVSVGRLWIYVHGERSGARFMFRKSAQLTDTPDLMVCDPFIDEPITGAPIPPPEGAISAYRPPAVVRVIAEGVTDPVDEAWLEALIALKGLAS